MEKEQGYELDYTKIFDKENLKICGVKFDSIEDWEINADSIAMNIYEGFKPTSQDVQEIKEGKWEMGNKDINNDEYKTNFEKVEAMKNFELLREKIKLDYQEKNEKKVFNLCIYPLTTALITGFVVAVIEEKGIYLMGLCCVVWIVFVLGIIKVLNIKDRRNEHQLSILIDERIERKKKSGSWVVDDRPKT